MEFDNLPVFLKQMLLFLFLMVFLHQILFDIFCSYRNNPLSISSISLFLVSKRFPLYHSHFGIPRILPSIHYRCSSASLTYFRSFSQFTNIDTHHHLNVLVVWHWNCFDYHSECIVVWKSIKKWALSLKNTELF